MTNETASGYAPELDEHRYTAPDVLPTALPDTVFVPGYRKTPVYSQQGGTCVGNSTGAALTHLEYMDSGGKNIAVFDGEALNARVTHAFDQPTSFAPVLDTVRANGIAPLSDEGLYFIEGYANVDYRNPDAIKAAIATHGQMCTLATWLTPEFGSNPTKPLPPHPGGQTGLHAMLLVGYVPEGVWVQNNWGDYWGDHGHVLLSWDYVANHFVEVMAITDKPDVSGGYVKTHQYSHTGNEESIKHTDLPDRKRPATYLVKDNGRIWITDPTQAKRFGVRLPATAVPDTDGRWALPVIGPDAPVQYR